MSSTARQRPRPTPPTRRADADRDAYVVGVDYGTLSGRAVVVRVRDGAQLGTAVTPYAHAVMEQTLAATGAALPPDWALQVPQDYVDVLREAVPAAVAAAGVDPAQRRRHRHRLHRVHGAAGARRRDAAVRGPRPGGPPARLRQAVEAPRRPAPRRPDQRPGPRAGRAVDRPLRRQDLQRVGVRQGAAAARGGPRALRRGPTPGSRPRTGSCGSCAAATSATPAPPATRASTRTAPTPRGSTSPRCDPGFASFAEDKLDATIGQLGERAGGLSAQAAAWTGLPEGIAVAVGNVDAHVTAPAAQAIDPGPDGRHHGHVDLPRHELRRARRGGRHVRRGRRRHHARRLRLRGRAERRRRHLRLVRPHPGPRLATRPPRPRPGSTCTSTSTELAARQEVGEHGLLVLDWHNGNRSVLVDHSLSGVVVGQTLQTRPEDTYRALLEATAFGTRTIVEAFEAAGVAVTELVVAGGLIKNRLLMQVYADVCRRPLSLLDADQGPALGSAIHAAVAAGCLPRRPRGLGGHGQGRPRGLHARTPTGPTPTTRCTRSTGRCTTTSAAAATTSCGGCARCGRRPTPAGRGGRGRRRGPATCPCRWPSTRSRRRSR